MSATAKELKEWAATLPDDMVVGIDEGGLTLVTYERTADQATRLKADEGNCSSWFEIGGVNIDEDEGDLQP